MTCIAVLRQTAHCGRDQTVIYRAQGLELTRKLGDGQLANLPTCACGEGNDKVRIDTVHFFSESAPVPA
jgi:hypothetical protein